jgi:hypothetical protein
LQAQRHPWGGVPAASERNEAAIVRTTSGRAGMWGAAERLQASVGILPSATSDGPWLVPPVTTPLCSLQPLHVEVDDALNLIGKPPDVDFLPARVRLKVWAQISRQGLA